MRQCLAYILLFGPTAGPSKALKRQWSRRRNAATALSNSPICVLSNLISIGSRNGRRRPISPSSSRWAFPCLPMFPATIPRWSAAGENLLSNAVKAVRDIGGVRLGGILYSAHGKYAQTPTDRGRKHSIAAIAKTADIAKEAGVELVLEIVNRFESNLLNTTPQGLDFIKRTGSDHVTLHLDTFHMNIEEVDPAMAIRLAGDKVGYFHIGESNRGYLGAGTINFDRIFDALVDIGYDRDVVFESFSSTIVDQSLSVACGIWRDTWTDNVPLAKHAKRFIELRYEEAKRRRATAMKA